MTTIPPANIAACPIPANALPIMKVTEVFATAQMTDPSSNIKTETRKVYLMLKYVYILPKVG